MPSIFTISLYMRRTLKRLFRSTFGLLGLLTCTACTAPADQSVCAVQELELQEGDLLFRRGSGILGRTVSALDQEGRYSHVGIVVQTSQGWCVVHAVPAEHDFEGDFDRVKCEPIAQFWDARRASHGAQYRYEGLGECRHAIARHACYWAEQAVPFDHQYDLADSSQLYCTELIERLYAAQGISLSEGRRTHFQFPSMSGDYILPSDITKNDLLTPIYSF